MKITASQKGVTIGKFKTVKIKNTAFNVFAIHFLAILKKLGFRIRWL